MKNIVIIGAGGVGREVSLIIQQINELEQTWNLLGFIDDNTDNWGKVINGYSVIGGIDSLEFLSNDTYIVIAIANYEVKKKIVNKVNNKFKFATIVHPKVWIHDYMTVGQGTIIYEGAILTANIEIGNHVIISPKCGVGHDSIIKDYVSLLWNVNVSGNDLIEEGVMMGSGSTVIQGKKIGKGSIIGAGAVVVNDIESFSTAVGVPAKVIKSDKSKRGNSFEEGIVCNNC
ncbi:MULTISPECIES: acetyltransferase [Clostridium]|uniref:Transferase hexapeptide domain-containing protein n=1 Tax=Clostridium disporicum TaxID=84024 RepID=A0A173Z4Z3_9CLOT|nr:MULTISPECIES: acetyltransferase [Clostridium]CUN70917.1 transferase hexapeptide domain-containing protein [Clostridium disporicum]CUO30893.1 transferase hexapeptide domain-containing protein [Clostridium disporicum]